MADENYEIKITVDSSGSVQDVKKLENALGDTSSAAKDVGEKSKSSFDLLGDAAKGAGVALAAMVGEQLVSNFFALNMEFDKLRAMLKTAAGSAEEGAVAFEQIKAFAATTPFDLQQATEGFVKMKSLGLDPTSASMTAFGDMSAAMGKDLMQMVEAVADAAGGEFERLKEFGIKSSKEGEKVRFTFKGITTEIENDSDAIVAELMRISNVNFSGAMAAQVDTLEGQISNLGDTWSQLIDEVMQDDTMAREFIAGLTSIVGYMKDDLMPFVKSGVDIIVGAFQIGGNTIKIGWLQAMKLLVDEFAGGINEMRDMAATFYDGLASAAGKIPGDFGENLRLSYESQAAALRQSLDQQGASAQLAGQLEEAQYDLATATGKVTEATESLNQQITDTQNLDLKTIYTTGAVSAEELAKQQLAAKIAIKEMAKALKESTEIIGDMRTPQEIFDQQKAFLDLAHAAKMSNGQINENRITDAEYAAGLANATEKMEKATGATRAREEAEKARAKIFDQTRTESEKLEIELAKLEKLYQNTDDADEYNRAVRALMQSTTEYKEQQKEHNKLIQEGQAIFASTETATEKYSRQLKALKAAYPNEQSLEFRRGLEQITVTLTGTMTAQQQYNQYTKEAKEIIAGTESAAEKYARQLLALDNYLLDTDDLAGFQTGLANITAEFKASSEAADEGSSAFADAAKAIEGSFSGLFSDIFSDAGNSFDNFAESLKESFVNLLAQLAAEAIKNKIYVALGITAEGGGLGGFISGLGGKITSGIGQLFTNPGGVLEKLGSMVSSIPGLLTGAKWGAGLLGLGAANTAGAAGATAAAGSAGLFSGAGMMSAIPVIGAIAGIGTLLYGIFGSGKKPIPDIAGFDTGLAADEIASVVAQDIKDSFRDSFNTAQTTSAFGTTIFGRPHGGGNKGGLTPDRWNELTEGLQTRLDAMTALDEVAAGFLSGDQEQAVIDAINIGITGGANKIEVAQAVKERYGIIFGAIDADLAAAFADTVGAVSGIEDTDKVLAAADDLLAIFGAFSANGLGGLDFSTALAMTTKLAGASGDLSDAYSKLAGKTEQYNALFGDSVDAEQSAIDAITNMRGEFEELGYAMPTTKEGFRALVEGLDMTTEAGRDAYLSLLDLAPGFADIAAQSVALDDALAQIATGFDNASVSMSGLLDDSIKKYLEFNFTPEQKQQAIGSEIDTLLTGLEQIIDPAQILDTVSKINQLTNEGFQLLTDEEQAGRAQQYAEFLQQVKGQADAQLIEAKAQAVADAQALQQAIRDALQPASDAQLQAAQLQIASAQLAYETAQIPVSVSVSFDTAEVGR